MQTESPLKPPESPLKPPRWQTESRWGLALTIVILGAWCSTLALLLPLPIGAIPIGWLMIAIAGRTFLHTGLFILAHDAMHLNLIPQHKSLNHWIGRISVGLYAWLSYAQCRRNHGQHHKTPAQVGDPDFHDGIHSHPVWWYWHFLRGYLSLRGFGLFTLGWSAIFLVSCGILHFSVLNIGLFWVLPLILSSMQLFMFGTYQPHRGGAIALSRRSDDLRSVVDHRQTPMQICWSLLSCYHFGNYHWEHHSDPKIPWYQLPHIHRADPKS